MNTKTPVRFLYGRGAAEPAHRKASASLEAVLAGRVPGAPVFSGPRPAIRKPRHARAHGLFDPQSQG